MPAILWIVLVVLGAGCAGLSRDRAGEGPGGALSEMFAHREIDALEQSVHLGPAAEIYEHAIAGRVEAQRRLGIMYAAGEDLPRNLTAAVDWLSRAAVQDDCAAQRELGLLYLGGSGLPYDLEKASFWLRRAADHSEDCTS